MARARRHWDRHGTGVLSFTELGFGSAPLGNLFRAITDAEAEVILETAWDNGVRHYDTAPLHGLGLSETRLNRSPRGKLWDEYFLSTQVVSLLKATTPDKRDGSGKWYEVPSRNDVYGFSHDAMPRSLNFSLKRLGVDRVDILYVHDIDVRNQRGQANLDASLAAFMKDATGRWSICVIRVPFLPSGPVRLNGNRASGWPCVAVWTCSCWPGAIPCSSRRH